jgi:protein-tyrosine phosphatase
VDIKSHKARQFVAEDFDLYDKIFAMDRSNFNRILDLASETHDTTKVEMIMNVVEPGSNRDVPDPYFGLRDGFENVFTMLDEACEIIAGRIENNKNL